MKKIVLIVCIIVGMSLISHVGWCDIAYVTDTFEVTLRTGPSTDHKVIAMLRSGRTVEVLDIREGWSQVRVAGSDEKRGWMLNRYLIKRKPWAAQVRILEKENSNLKQAMPDLESQLSETVKRETDLDGKLKKTTESLGILRKQYDTLKKEAAGFLELKSKYNAARSDLEHVRQELETVTEENKSLRSSIRNKWFLTGALVLLFGLIIGVVIGRREKGRRSSLYL